MRACEDCGKPLLHGVSSRRRFCDRACQSRSYRARSVARRSAEFRAVLDELESIRGEIGELREEVRAALREAPVFPGTAEPTDGEPEKPSRPLVARI